MRQTWNSEPWISSPLGPQRLQLTYLVSFLPTQSLPSFAASCRACNEAIAHDEHWQEGYLNRWQQPTVDVSSWRTHFKNAHIDGMLKKHTDVLLARIKKLVNMWAEEVCSSV
jgi:hypothetical protein